MKNSIVVKSNLLVEASYKLTAQEQRVILTLTSKIRPDDEDFKEYSISVKEFAQMIGVSLNGRYEDVKDITKKLIGRVFTIYEPTGPLQLAWLSSAKYLEGEGTVSLRFDPGLKPYLLQLKDCFTKFSLTLALRLKSSFSIRIYELLKQYESIGVRTFLLSELKETLGISGDQYKLYGHFKAKVLQVAYEELAAKTDLAFDYEEIKVGRGVGKIRFIIKSQVVPLNSEHATSPDIPVNSEDIVLTQLIELLPKIFQEKQSIKKIVLIALKKHDVDYVMRNIIYANDKSNALKTGTSQDKGSNYRVYLAKALNNDYGLAYHEDLQSKKEVEQVKQKTFAEAEKQKHRENSKIDEERDNRGKARAFIASYAPETMQTYEEEAKKRMSPEALIRYLRKDTIGLFEFKRRLEDVVMEHTGIIKISEKQEQSS